MTDCNALIRDRLREAFDGQVSIDENQGDCRVVLPFYRVDGDPIILYVSEDDGQYRISDEGETHGMLLTSGVDLDTEKRENRVETAKERFGLEASKTEISLTATADELGPRLLDAYQAVQWISFLVYTRRPYSPSYFKDKVAGFLRQNELPFEEDVEVNTGSDEEEVDFRLDTHGYGIYLEAIQARDGSDLHDKSRDTALKWIRIGRADSNARFVTVLDDIDGEYKKERMAPLFEDSDAVVPWSERDDLLKAVK